MVVWGTRRVQKIPALQAESAEEPASEVSWRDMNGKMRKLRNFTKKKNILTPR